MIIVLVNENIMSFVGQVTLSCRAVFVTVHSWTIEQIIMNVQVYLHNDPTD